MLNFFKSRYNDTDVETKPLRVLLDKLIYIGSSIIMGAILLFMAIIVIKAMFNFLMS